MSTRRRFDAAVVGAGAFGGWTALELARRGLAVALVDAWGPGNPRASSGGETRVLRAIYGADGWHAELAARALARWRGSEALLGAPLWHKSGVLWLAAGDNRYPLDALPHLERLGLPCEILTPAAAARRWPHIRFDGVESVLLEPEAGYLEARRACRRVVDAFRAAGGAWLRAAVPPAAVAPEALAGGELGEVTLTDGSRLSAAAWVFACGPWLPTLFPELLGARLAVTRQEVYHFGTPPGDGRFLATPEGGTPVWADMTGERFLYGIPDDGSHGFKVGDDTRGPAFDPTAGERQPDAGDLARARRFLARRFPELAGAPLLEARICQYTNTTDGRFLLDRHPRAENLWLAGGGSGHGFKLGPVVGEMMADLLTGAATPDPRTALARLG